MLCVAMHMWWICIKLQKNLYFQEICKHFSIPRKYQEIVHQDSFENYKSLKDSSGFSFPRKSMSFWIPSLDQNKWILSSSVLNVTATWVVTFVICSMQKSFASLNWFGSRSPKRKAITETRWKGGAWHACNVFSNMSRIRCFKILHLDTSRIVFFFKVSIAISLRVSLKITLESWFNFVELLIGKLLVIPYNWYINWGVNMYFRN